MRGFAITAQGAQLLTKVAGGAGTLQITAVKVGKGLPEGDPSLLTDLVSPVALGSCTVPKVENNRMSMVVEYRNDMDGGLKEDFMLSEFGIFAKVKELEEDAVLLYIGVLGDNPGVVSAWNGNNLESRRYPVSIVVSKDLQVEINFPAGAFITSDEFDEAMETHNKSISSHSDIRAMATETYNSETTYTAGAYCIHDGKLYKAQADISAPEEWTESHWTLTSVGAELQELEAALSNKADKVPPQRYVLPLSAGWVRVNSAEYWMTQRPVGYAAHAAASTMSAVPAVVWVGDDGVIYASTAQEVPGSSDPNSDNWPGFAGTMVFCAN